MRTFYVGAILDVLIHCESLTVSLRKIRSPGFCLPAMSRAVSCSTLVVLSSFPLAYGQDANAKPPKIVWSTGQQALRLISLLASGNEDFKDVIALTTGLVIQNLEVCKQSTFEYDPNASLYKLDMYRATAKIGDAKTREEIKLAI